LIYTIVNCPMFIEREKFVFIFDGVTTVNKRRAVNLSVAEFIYIIYNSTIVDIHMKLIRVRNKHDRFVIVANYKFKMSCQDDSMLVRRSCSFAIKK